MQAVTTIRIHVQEGNCPVVKMEHYTRFWFLRWHKRAA